MAAVECKVGTFVDRVGFYLFDTTEAASAAYLRRVDEEGLELDTRVRASRWERTMWGCQDELSDDGEGGPECSQYREAGYINASGYANYRAVFDRLYIGVLGEGRDVGALRDWAWSIDHWAPPEPGELGMVPSVPTLYEGELLVP